MFSWHPFGTPEKEKPLIISRLSGAFCTRSGNIKNEMVLNDIYI